MKTPYWPFGSNHDALQLPEGTDIFTMNDSEILLNPEESIRNSITNPINSKSLHEIILSKKKKFKNPKTVIVISDNTRPVPYKGKSGILWPIVECLLKDGIKKSNITILVATGTHRAMAINELKEIIDNRVFDNDIRIINHDCRDNDSLTYLCKTSRGSEVYVNRIYLEAQIKILTGLVESHFMAGVSGGRKSICPGLVGEKSTYIFHGAPMMSDPMVEDLKLEGNPCHDEALEIARSAGADFILNVTLNNDFYLTGVFAGDLENAHVAAVEKLKSYTAIKIDRQYDIVAVHAGFVGINHYQAVKAGTIAASVVKPGGKVLMVADNTDSDPVGGLGYKTVLQLLKILGPDKLEKLLLSNDWIFIPEQWQVQMWCKLFRKIPIENFWYYSPQFDKKDYAIIPGNPLTELVPTFKDCDEKSLFERALHRIKNITKKELNYSPSIVWMQDGPYGIPFID